MNVPHEAAAMELHQRHQQLEKAVMEFLGFESFFVLIELQSHLIWPKFIYF